MKWLIQFFAGLFQGWYAERSRDKAHESKGQAEAKFKTEKSSNEKIIKADTARARVDSELDSLLNDPNRRK